MFFVNSADLHSPVQHQENAQLKCTQVTCCSNAQTMPHRHMTTTWTVMSGDIFAAICEQADAHMNVYPLVGPNTVSIIHVAHAHALIQTVPHAYVTRRGIMHTRTFDRTSCSVGPSSHRQQASRF